MARKNPRTTPDRRPDHCDHRHGPNPAVRQSPGIGAAPHLDPEQLRSSPRTARPLGGRLIARASARAICHSRRSTMKQQAIEGRRDWAAAIIEVGLYSALILVVTLLWVYIPA